MLGKIDWAVVCGSGIKFQGREVFSVKYSEIPGFPEPLVSGHSGVLKVFKVGWKKLLVFEGRLHYYEGRTDEEMRAIPFLAKKLGVKRMILTCASGLISRSGKVGEIGIVKDHINLMGRNPLVGLVKHFHDKVFIDGKDIYDKELFEKAIKTAKTLGITLKPVVLAGVLGPNYETNAELDFLEKAGADCVSMSTIPEALISRFFGMKVLAFTIFTNDARKSSAHKEVLKVSRKSSEKLWKIIRKIVLTYR